MKKIIFILSFVVSLCIGCSASVSSVALSANKNAPTVKENKTMKTLDSAQKEEKRYSAEYEKYTSQENYFSVAIPRDWTKKEKDHPYGDLTKISGIRLTGPRNKDGAPITLSVLYYSGERFFTTTEAFIRNKLNSMVRIDYDKETVILDIALAGRPGKKFQIKTFELVYLPMREIPPTVEGRVYEIVPPHIQVNMIQQFIVIPAQKGFYVLNYGVPEDMAEEYKHVFEKVVASFEPHLP